MRFLGKILLCEFRWALFCLAHPSGRLGECLKAGDRRTPSEQIVYLHAKRKLFQNLLRSTPWWTKGHLQLGLTYLDLEQVDGGTGTSRRAAAMRVSALAVLSTVAHGVKEKRLAVERKILTAEYLLAMALFFLEQYQEAYKGLKRILSSESRSCLPYDVGMGLLEYAGISAMFSGEKEEAFACLNAIPVQERSSQIKLILKGLAKGHSNTA